MFHKHSFRPDSTHEYLSIFPFKMKTYINRGNSDGQRRLLLGHRCGWRNLEKNNVKNKTTPASHTMCLLLSFVFCNLVYYAGRSLLVGYSCLQRKKKAHSPPALRLFFSPRVSFIGMHTGATGKSGCEVPDKRTTGRSEQGALDASRGLSTRPGQVLYPK